MNFFYTVFVLVISLLVFYSNVFAEYTDNQLHNERYSEEDIEKQTSNNNAPKYINLGLNACFNTKDIFFGADYSFFLSREYLLLCDLSFYFRPYKKTVFVKERENYYYQLKERRYLLGFSIDKLFLYDNVYGVYITGGGGYTFGSFAGTETIDSESRFTPLYGAGAALFFGDSFLLKCGYQYIKIPHVPPNRLFFEAKFFY